MRPGCDQQSQQHSVFHLHSFRDRPLLCRYDRPKGRSEKLPDAGCLSDVSLAARTRCPQPEAKSVRFRTRCAAPGSVRRMALSGAH